MKKIKADEQIRIMILLAAVILLYGIFSADRIYAESNGQKIEDTREALDKWVQTQRLISEEKRDLAIAKEILNERIELVEQEIKSLREQIGSTEQSIAEADKKREEMIKENEKLKEATSSLLDTLVVLENRTAGLLKKLPDPIRDRVKPLSQRLPKNQQDTKLSVSQRFQNVVGILNEVDKFNREITVTSEVRELDNGSSVEVTAFYAGIGYGYYCNSDGTIAGAGTVWENEWSWQLTPEAAEEISQAIAILKNEQPASFVKLPVEIKN